MLFSLWDTHASGLVLNLSLAIRPGNSDYSFDLRLWHFLSEGSFSLQQHHIDRIVMIDRARLPYEHSSSDNYLKQTKSITCRLGSTWQRDAIKIHKEHAVNSLTHLSDFSRMLTVEPNMSADENDSPWEPRSQVTDTEEKPNAIRQV